MTIIPADGIYSMIINMTSNNNNPFNTTIEVEMVGEYGYLSAAGELMGQIQGFHTYIYL